MENKRILLVMEVDLAKRFKFFEEHYKIPSHVLNLKNSLKLSKLETITSRLTYKKSLVSEYQKFKQRLESEPIEDIYISNPEGYIAKNIIRFLRRDFPRKRIISLQHGIFSLDEESSFKKFIKMALNKILFPFVGYDVIGDGFGIKSTDKYIVYNSIYRDHLIRKGWNENEIAISSFILKGEKGVETPIVNDENNAIIFLQCLSKLGITDHDSEMKMIKNITTKLSKKYSKVFLKQHPYASIDLPKLPENCEVIPQTPELNKIALIVSAFSTALLDFEKYGIPCVAIKYDMLNVDPSIYDQFLNIHHFDENIDKDFDFKENPKRSGLSHFYEVGESSLENI